MAGKKESIKKSHVKGLNEFLKRNVATAPAPIPSEQAIKEEHVFSAAEGDKFLAQLHTREDLNEKIANRQMRKVAAICVFAFMCIWSIALWVLIWWVGFTHNFEYDSTVLVTLIGGSSVSVIGLVGFVVKGLFGPPLEGRAK